MDITQEEIAKLLEIEKIEKDNKDSIITCIRKLDTKRKMD